MEAAGCRSRGKVQSLTAGYPCCSPRVGARLRPTTLEPEDRFPPCTKRLLGLGQHPDTPAGPSPVQSLQVMEYRQRVARRRLRCLNGGTLLVTARVNGQRRNIGNLGYVYFIYYNIYVSDAGHHPELSQIGRPEGSL